MLTSFIPPDFVHELGAKYPPGKVAFTLNIHGEPENFHVEQPTSPDLEKAVFDALRRWRFQPAMKSEEAVPVHGSLQYQLTTAR